MIWNPDFGGAVQWAALCMALIGVAGFGFPPTSGLFPPPTHSELVCTVSSKVDPDTGQHRPVTTCLHTERRGSQVTSPPPTLHAHIASTGCFYLGSRSTQWVNLGIEDDGTLQYGWSANGRRGGHSVVGTAQPCSWSGVEREEIEGFVWSKIASYVHQAPQVQFNPAVPWGMAGIEAFARMTVPPRWGFSSTSPYTGRTLRAEVQVSQVDFDWDDGPLQVFGPSSYSRFTGYPNGVARRTYQTKTCGRGGRRCHENKSAYRIRVSFRWSGWYEVAGARKSLRISKTYSDTDYPVRETISLVVG